MDPFVSGSISFLCVYVAGLPLMSVVGIEFSVQLMKAVAQRAVERPA